MILNQAILNYENMLPMLIQNLADATNDRQFLLHQLDDDIMFMSEEDTNFQLVGEVMVSEWVYVEAHLPDPEFDRVLWELVKLYSKYDIELTEDMTI